MGSVLPSGGEGASLYYINQPRTPTFPIEMVKTGSDFIVKSVEIYLGRRMLVVAVISVDTYPFFLFFFQTWPVILKIQK